MECFAMDGWESEPPSPFNETMAASPALNESDKTWKEFLPADYKEIISRSDSPVDYRSKKELYFHLCNNPILLDQSRMSFQLNERSGEKCYMLGARALSISRGDDPRYWEWTSHANSRFPEVARQIRACWLDIRGKVKIQTLSKNTVYAAYFVYNIEKESHGFDETPVEVPRGFYGTPVELCLKYGRKKTIRNVYLASEESRQRSDGWMEFEMGEFYNDVKQTDRDIAMRLSLAKNLNLKCGLIVLGIELRPMPKGAVFKPIRPVEVVFINAGLKGKVVIKVDHGQRAPKKALEIVVRVPGVETVALRGPETGLIEVIGYGIDPVALVSSLRKNEGLNAQIVSVTRVNAETDGPAYQGV